jgi:hypothetical protein
MNDMYGHGGRRGLTGVYRFRAGEHAMDPFFAGRACSRTVWNRAMVRLDEPLVALTAGARNCATTVERVGVGFVNEPRHGFGLADHFSRGDTADTTFNWWSGDQRRSR